MPEPSFDRLLEEVATGNPSRQIRNAAAAVDMFRGLVLAAGGLSLRDDVPVVFKANYAAALFASGNVAGGRGVLAEMRGEEHPAVEKLRAAARRWAAGLTLWQKVSWFLGGQPDRPFVLDGPPGDLE